VRAVESGSSWMPGTLRAGLCTASLLLFHVPFAASQPATPALLDGWHVVRPGETLWDLAERYLGSEEAWPKLHALNPDVANPHQIKPGQRVRVQVFLEHGADVAQVATVSRRVEEQLRPLPWLPSSERDMLNPRDGVRTYESSSSELVFPDATRLTISEDSLVFLGQGGTVRREVRRDEIEIVVGQADLTSRTESGSRDVVVGGSRVTTSPRAANEARLRRPDAGGAQVMVYAGETVVESGGAAQEVAAGTGTRVAEGEPPSPPEKLLPAVELAAPADGSEWPRGGPAFAWSPVAGAAGYVFEVCHDPRCGRLVRRRTGLESVETAGADLDAGTYHWRVTAVSPSGLDGYPSASASFTVLAAADEDPPEIRAELTGPRHERDGTLYLGPGARLEVEVTDVPSGVERAWAVLDGADVALEKAQEGWTPGAHEVVIHARDRAGNEGRSAALAFTYDPLPPEIHWGAESGGLYHTFAGEAAPWTDGERRGGAPELVWSTDRAAWQATERREWTLRRSVAPRFFLRADGRGGRVWVLPNVSLPVKRRHGIGVLASDALAGTDTLVFRIVDGGEGAGGRRLVVEATDHVGNRSSVSWLLRRGGAARR